MKFIDLLSLHRQLDELFFVHQSALMRLDHQKAAEALREFEKQLLLHIRDEEELMLPVYRERVAAPVGGTVAIFEGEHAKLRQYLALFKEELTGLKSAEDLERRVLFLIDSQHIFKRLLVHHDTRERKMLYPLLDEVVTETERVALLSSLELRLHQSRC